MSRGRPPLPVGTWGAIRYQRGRGGWRARARFRDLDGRTRDIERTGPTKGAARDALTTALRDRVAPEDNAITGDTTLHALIDLWHAEGRDGWAINTRVRYREVADDHLVPALGDLRVREATVTRLDAYLKRVTKSSGPSTARQCKAVLSGALALAVRHGAAPGNPLRGVAPIRVTRKAPTALTVEQVLALRAAARAHEAPRPGPGAPRHPGIATIVDTLLGTGARIGEVLALRWADVDLAAATVTICGTVVRDDETRHLVRQERPKTDAGHRTLQVPPFLVTALLAHRVSMTHGTDGDLVFPSAAGTLREPGNTHRLWRRLVADAGLPKGTTPHAIRRTVATAIDEAADVATAAAQLGHAGTAVTARHYVQRAAVGPDVRDVLEGFGG